MCQGALSSVLGGKGSLIHGAQVLVREEPFWKEITQEDCGRCCWYLTLSPELSLLQYTRCYPEILHLRAFRSSGHRASWKCQGTDIPRSSPQLLINGNQKKSSSFLTLWSGTTLKLILQFPKKNLLSNACAFSSFPSLNRSPLPEQYLPSK